MGLPQPTAEIAGCCLIEGIPHVKPTPSVVGETGIARCGCVNTGELLQKLCARPTLPRTSHPPGRSPHKQAGTNTQDRLTSTTARCLLQTNQTPAVPGRGGAHAFKQHRREGRRKYQVTKSKQASKQARGPSIRQVSFALWKAPLPHSVLLLHDHKTG